MGLIINQGKQDTSKDNQFEVIISKDELVQIVKLEMDADWENTLKVTLKIIGENSKYKNRLVWDRVSFSGEFAWKYRSLRKAAGVPYVESESPNVDIEALLLNKAVNVELTARKGNDGNDYQSIKYKAIAAKPAATKVASAPVVEATVEEDVIVDENPFDSAPNTDSDVEW
jgi:hypothetical protein